MVKRIGRRSATAVMLVAAATLTAGSQAASAYAPKRCEHWMEVPMEAGMPIATLVGDDAGNVIRDYSIRLETTSTKKYVVFTYSTSSGVCQR